MVETYGSRPDRNLAFEDNLIVEWGTGSGALFTSGDFVMYVLSCSSVIPRCAM